MSGGEIVIDLDNEDDPVANEALESVANEIARGPHPDNVYVNTMPLSEEFRQKQLETALAVGCVTRTLIEDNVVDLAILKSDPMWEMDPVTENWLRRTPEFFAARGEAEERLTAEREAAKIALGVTLLELERDLPSQADGPRSTLFYVGDYIVTYAVIASFDPGIYPSHRSSGDAIREWRQRLMAFVGKASGDTLWWRCRPEIDGRVTFGDTHATWYVYSRLAIGSGTPEADPDA